MLLLQHSRWSGSKNNKIVALLFFSSQLISSFNLNIIQAMNFKLRMQKKYLFNESV